ncbi:hypothetical protein K402DRAFT_53275 [Aulographum hederae CBS 113979]|uniref:Sodium/calcium exchanger membrane region domain-containing protein n=1 Tax=Aulographum hederae CBS 113979 TaxID=1176131 RepID=A0A6G1H2E8_9PEZI|nr:hypothetical protein K402DRAFT_53275 [Aulographum hederae CBS 113979]
MGKTSDFWKFSDRLPWVKANAPGRDPQRTELPLSEKRPTPKLQAHNRNGDGNGTTTTPLSAAHGAQSQSHHSGSTSSTAADNTSPASSPSAPPQSTHEATREKSPPVKQNGEPPHKPNIFIRFWQHVWTALTHSWLNVLLIFVPVGIASEAAHMSPTIIFAMNAIAVVPLAGLLTHATETVSRKLGDSWGALLNVSFGNAVELIIFIIALVKNEVRIVQASILGSILANLLLILGMAFLLGGLRFREQIYNNTATQMHACMLSLSVMSLLLPTAFHASFADTELADRRTLKISRGTSVVLLLVYVLFLLFQLKSHKHLYASTPQHIIDEESYPGVLHHAFESSSDSSSTSDGDSSDTDSSSGSHTTARKRIKRAFRMRSKSTASSVMTGAVSSPSLDGNNHHFGSQDGHHGPHPANEANHYIRRKASNANDLGAIASGDEADVDLRHERRQTKVRDFGGSDNASINSPESGRGRKRAKKRSKKRHHRRHANEKQPGFDEKEALRLDSHSSSDQAAPLHGEVQTIAPQNQLPLGSGVPSSRLPSALRQFSAAKPSLLSNNVFTNPATLEGQPSTMRPGLQRSRSLPEMKDREQQIVSTVPPFPRRVAVAVDDEEEGNHMSPKAAVVMLLISTALVAVCAEFLVDAIPEMTENSNVSQAFIGLIILPIVGNAAEHVSAVTVAYKNKMDLALNIAVGSSIQIALFVTPLVVLLGWFMDKDMTLFFNIFETISLFVTAFVINFLILDGRSNYLEGALLIAAYVIIAVCAFYYPDTAAQSELGGSESEGVARLLRLFV